MTGTDLTWLCDQCGAMAADHTGNRCPDTEATDPTAGHRLSFTWRREPPAAAERVAYCLAPGCKWTRPAPGTAYTAGRKAHDEHLAELRHRAPAGV